MPAASRVHMGAVGWWTESGAPMTVQAEHLGFAGTLPPKGAHHAKPAARQD
jgi:hypothetical protein